MSNTNFPLLYHAHQDQFDQDISFWQAVAAAHSGPLLELGCGTGRVLLHLAQQGHEVWGIDRDAAMLTFLQSQIPADQLARVHLVQADLTNFRFSQRFASIFLPCNTLSVLSVQQQQWMVRQIVNHLQPGGVFAASIPNPLILQSLPQEGEPVVEDTFTHPLSGNPVQVITEWRRSSKVFRVQWHYDHLLPTGQMERFSLALDHQITFLEQYQQRWLASGLEITAIYGDFDGSDYRDDSPYLILEAHRG